MFDINHILIVTIIIIVIVIRIIIVIIGAGNMHPLDKYLIKLQEDGPLHFYKKEHEKEELEESKRTSMTHVTRDTKIKKATGQLASIEARKKHDPLYQKMMYYRDLYFKYREQIYKKYAPRVRSRARK